MGSERDRAIAEAVRDRIAQGLHNSEIAKLAMASDCRKAEPGRAPAYHRSDIYEQRAQALRDERDIAEALDTDAIIAAVDAQHPAPALPRDVARRIAEEFHEAKRVAAHYKLVGSVAQWQEAEKAADLAAIVSRHLPTDEEREAEREVVEAAVREAEARERMQHVGTGSRFSAMGELRIAEMVRGAAADRLLAIRAKRGAR